MNTVQNAVLESLSIVASALDDTASKLVGSVVPDLRSRQGSNISVNGAAFEWIKGIFRREWRIDCLDVSIRL